jgi:hypothetical protein
MCPQPITDTLPGKVEVVCPHCSKLFMCYRYRILHAAGRPIYCSFSCRARGAERLRRPIEERFWAKVDKSAGPEGCWLWTAGAIGGYGRISAGGRHGKHIMAHRLSYKLAYGPVPPGHDILHSCDNPPCVNPLHLFAGTAQSNTEDARSKGRLATGQRNGRYTFPERTYRGGRKPRHEDVIRQ